MASDLVRFEDADVVTAVDFWQPSEAWTDLCVCESHAPAPSAENPGVWHDAIPDWLIAEADLQYGRWYGTQLYYHYYLPWHDYGLRSVTFDGGLAWDGDFMTNGLAIVDSGNVSSTASALQFSSTNVQHAGVDEADLMENDGSFLYLVSNGELTIIDARDPESMKIASRIKLGDHITGMYLSGDRLTLLQQTDVWDATTRQSIFNDSIYSSHFPSRNLTTVTILDVKDRSQPQFVQRTDLDGAVTSSRMVNGQLRLVLEDSGARFVLPSIGTIENHPSDASNGPNCGPRYETRAEYLKRLREAWQDFRLPSYRTISLDGEVVAEQALIDSQSDEFQRRWGNSTVTTIAVWDVHRDSPGPTATKTLFTNGVAQVYATQESLYLFGHDFFSNHANASEGELVSVLGPYEQTAIWKFAFSDDGSATLSARGWVSGTLLNQFAADEHDGFLRVVTQAPGWSNGQEIQVLKQEGERLELVGRLSEIALGESLYSVRFAGDRAFAVTFRIVDPLFTIDLSDPTSPRVAGELKIPGYSDYLQPLDNDHLLAIGRGADEVTGWFEELQVSIFDVSDFDSPQLAHRYAFEGGRSTSTIVTGDRWTRGDGDHHAMSYFASAKILALPLHSEYDPWAATSIWETWDGESTTESTKDDADASPFGHGRLQVFTIDVHAGLTPVAIISHDAPIVRSVQLGDALVAISSQTVTAHKLNAPSQEIGRLVWQAASDDGLVELTLYEAPQPTGDLQAISFVEEERSPASSPQPVLPPKDETAPVKSAVQQKASADQPTSHRREMSRRDAFLPPPASEAVAEGRREDVRRQRAFDAALTEPLWGAFDDLIASQTG